MSRSKRRQRPRRVRTTLSIEEAIELGVAVGLACAAGIATDQQTARLLDGFSQERRVSEAVARVLIEQAMSGREIRPEDFRNALAEMVAAATVGESQ